MKRGNLLWATRYALPATICLVGIVFLIASPAANIEGAAALVGAGLSVALLNFLHRVGVEGDVDRRHEDDARRYFDKHGHWPDERPRTRGSR